MSEPAAVYTLPVEDQEPDLSAYQQAAAAQIAAEAGTSLAVAEALGGDLITREARLQVIEQTFTQIRDQYVRSHLGLGALLLEYRELCRSSNVHTCGHADREMFGGGEVHTCGLSEDPDDSRFLAFVARSGFSRTHAYNLMTVATIAAQFPTIGKIAETQFQKALALIQGTTDEQIAQIEAGDGPLTLDEIDQLSVRKLKARVRQIEADKDKLVKRETASLRAERDGLKKENAKLSALVGDDLDSIRKVVYRLDEEINTAIRTVGQLYRQLDALIVDPADNNRYTTQIIDQIDARIGLLSKQGTDLWQAWFEKRLIDYGQEGVV
jgi:hypothetical protein